VSGLGEPSPLLRCTHGHETFASASSTFQEVRHHASPDCFDFAQLESEGGGDVNPLSGASADRQPLRPMNSVRNWRGLSGSRTRIPVRVVHARGFGAHGY
jgi:hypothetical protein